MCNTCLKMGAHVCWLLLLLGSASLSLVAQGVDEASQTVVIDLGDDQQLKGLNVSSPSGVNVYKFFGVPYAQPPIGDLRFQPPRPALNWTGIKDAVSKSPMCSQGILQELPPLKSEDCLYLNVFTPDVNGSLPVYVWIHGGAYRAGSAYSDGDRGPMARQGVVAVTINYRLGPLGFLSTADDVMPGNYGMLDQVEALKWVQKYISAFGGDPNQVTIGGQSAGSFSVSLIIVSPLAKGLFKRAIMESGSSLCISAVVQSGYETVVRDSTLQAAARLGCNETDSVGILQCLQSATVNELMIATRDTVCEPRVESKFGFLPDYPFNLLKAGKYNKVDTLHGTNSGEVAWLLPDPEDDGTTRQQFQDSVTSQVGNYSNSGELITGLVDGYIGNQTDPFVIRSTLVQWGSDIVFGAGTLVEINKFITAPNVSTRHYLYEFYYRTSSNKSPAWLGVDHGEERPFAFYPDSNYNYTTADDRAVGQAVSTMWINFIKYGNPTPERIPQNGGPKLVTWAAFTQSHPNLLEIDVVSRLVAYPRLFLIGLYEKILELTSRNTQDTTIVG